MFLSDIQVAERYGISRASVWRWVRKGELPKPIQLGEGTTRWKLTDLEKYEADRAKNSAA